MSKYELLQSFCEPLEWFRDKGRASFFILPKKNYIFNVEFGPKKVVGKFADGTNKKFTISKKTSETRLYLDSWSFMDGSLKILIEKQEGGTWLGRVKMGKEKTFWYVVE
nr:hypothetical protein [Marseillevirus cajuinensis]